MNLLRKELLAYTSPGKKYKNNSSTEETLQDHLKHHNYYRWFWHLVDVSMPSKRENKLFGRNRHTIYHQSYQETVRISGAHCQPLFSPWNHQNIITFRNRKATLFPKVWSNLAILFFEISCIQKNQQTKMKTVEVRVTWHFTEMVL